MFYHRGPDWYHGQFDTAQSGSVSVDMTPSYVRDLKAHDRIHAYNPDAKIILCLREPLTRAFSHYWHNKKKSDFQYSFESVFKNYDLFNSWVQTGFYADHIERYLTLFDRKHIHVQLFDDLEHNPQGFIQDTYRFMGVDDTFLPETIGKKVNEAKTKKSKFRQNVEKNLRKLRLYRVVDLMNAMDGDNREHLEGVDAVVLAQLHDIFDAEITRLEKLLDINLSAWRNVN